MHKRALRRRKKVVRGGRVPLRRRGVRRAPRTDDATRHTHTDADADANPADAQTGSAPHRSPVRRARRRQARTHAESDSKPHGWRRRRRLLLLLLWLRRRRL